MNILNPKVLVVNDEHFNLQMMVHVVRNFKITDIDISYNGFEAYNKIISKSYDLVICDLNMPVMDGY
jgi:CheY-like chemotaxis protein